MFSELLISLTGNVPDDMSQFTRVADLISDDEEDKQLGRLRFKAYRGQGLTPATHNISL